MRVNPIPSKTSSYLLIIEGVKSPAETVEFAVDHLAEDGTTATTDNPQVFLTRLSDTEDKFYAYVTLNRNPPRRTRLTIRSNTQVALRQEILLEPLILTPQKAWTAADNRGALFSMVREIGEDQVEFADRIDRTLDLMPNSSKQGMYAAVEAYLGYFPEAFTVPKNSNVLRLHVSDWHAIAYHARPVLERINASASGVYAPSQRVSEVIRMTSDGAPTAPALLRSLGMSSRLTPAPDGTVHADRIQHTSDPITNIIEIPGYSGEIEVEYAPATLVLFWNGRPTPIEQVIRATMHDCRHSIREAGYSSYCLKEQNSYFQIDPLQGCRNFACPLYRANTRVATTTVVKHNSSILGESAFALVPGVYEPGDVVKVAPVKIFDFSDKMSRFTVPLEVSVPASRKSGVDLHVAKLRSIKEAIPLELSGTYTPVDVTIADGQYMLSPMKFSCGDSRVWNLPSRKVTRSSKQQTCFEVGVETPGRSSFSDAYGLLTYKDQDTLYAWSYNDTDGYVGVDYTVVDMQAEEHSVRFVLRNVANDTIFVQNIRYNELVRSKSFSTLYARAAMKDRIVTSTTGPLADDIEIMDLEGNNDTITPTPLDASVKCFADQYKLVGAVLIEGAASAFDLLWTDDVGTQAWASVGVPLPTGAFGLVTGATVLYVLTADSTSPTYSTWNAATGAITNTNLSIANVDSIDGIGGSIFHRSAGSDVYPIAWGWDTFDTVSMPIVTLLDPAAGDNHVPFVGINTALSQIIPPAAPASVTWKINRTTAFAVGDTVSLDTNSEGPEAFALDTITSGNVTAEENATDIAAAIDSAATVTSLSALAIGDLVVITSPYDITSSLLTLGTASDITVWDANLSETTWSASPTIGIAWVENSFLMLENGIVVHCDFENDTALAFGSGAPNVNDTDVRISCSSTATREEVHSRMVSVLVGSKVYLNQPVVPIHNVGQGRTGTAEGDPTDPHYDEINNVEASSAGVNLPIRWRRIHNNRVVFSVAGLESIDRYVELFIDNGSNFPVPLSFRTNEILRYSIPSHADEVALTYNKPPDLYRMPAFRRYEFDDIDMLQVEPDTGWIADPLFTSGFPESGERYRVQIEPLGRHGYAILFEEDGRIRLKAKVERKGHINLTGTGGWAHVKIEVADLMVGTDHVVFGDVMQHKGVQYEIPEETFNQLAGSGGVDVVIQVEGASGLLIDLVNASPYPTLPDPRFYDSGLPDFTIEYADSRYKGRDIPTGLRAETFHTEVLAIQKLTRYSQLSTTKEITPSGTFTDVATYAVNAAGHPATLTLSYAIEESLRDVAAVSIEFDVTLGSKYSAAYVVFNAERGIHGNHEYWGVGFNGPGDIGTKHLVQIRGVGKDMEWYKIDTFYDWDTKALSTGNFKVEVTFDTNTGYGLITVYHLDTTWKPLLQSTPIPRMMHSIGSIGIELMVSEGDTTTACDLVKAYVSNDPVLVEIGDTAPFYNPGIARVTRDHSINRAVVPYYCFNGLNKLIAVRDFDTIKLLNTDLVLLDRRVPLLAAGSSDVKVTVNGGADPIIRSATQSVPISTKYTDGSIAKGVNVSVSMAGHPQYIHLTNPNGRTDSQGKYFAEFKSAGVSPYPFFKIIAAAGDAGTPSAAFYSIGGSAAPSDFALHPDYTRYMSPVIFLTNTTSTLLAAQTLLEEPILYDRFELIQTDTPSWIAEDEYKYYELSKYPAWKGFRIAGYREVFSKAEVKADTFYCDYDNKILWIHSSDTLTPVTYGYLPIYIMEPSGNVYQQFPLPRDLAAGDVVVFDKPVLQQMTVTAAGVTQSVDMAILLPAVHPPAATPAQDVIEISNMQIILSPLTGATGQVIEENGGDCIQALLTFTASAATGSSQDRLAGASITDIIWEAHGPTGPNNEFDPSPHGPDMVGRLANGVKVYTGSSWVHKTATFGIGLAAGSLDGTGSIKIALTWPNDADIHGVPYSDFALFNGPNDSGGGLDAATYTATVVFSAGGKTAVAKTEATFNSPNMSVQPLSDDLAGKTYTIPLTASNNSRASGYGLNMDNLSLTGQYLDFEVEDGAVQGDTGWLSGYVVELISDGIVREMFEVGMTDQTNGLDRSAAITAGKERSVKALIPGDIDRMFLYLPSQEIAYANTTENILYALFNTTQGIHATGPTLVIGATPSSFKIVAGTPTRSTGEIQAGTSDVLASEFARTINQWATVNGKVHAVSFGNLTVIRLIDPGEGGATLDISNAALFDITLATETAVRSDRITAKISTSPIKVTPQGVEISL